MTPSPITPGDSLAAVVAELRECARVFNERNDNMLDSVAVAYLSVADRIERLDAEMRKSITAMEATDANHAVTCGYYEGIISLREKDLAEMRAKLAACERLRHEWLARAASTTQRQYANRILDCANDLNNALASRAAGEK